MSWFMSYESDYAREMRWRLALDTPMPIRQALLQQSRLAGLGNIYSSEACWMARVHPERPARDLTRTELFAMIHGVPEMLLRSAMCGGTSFGDANSFKDIFGHEGRNLENLKVYGRDGLECKRYGCSGTIQRVVMAGRSTFFCDRCQK